MIDQSLRDALISHWDENCNGVDWLAGTPEEYASEAIRFLAAHPAEPAVDDLAARLRASVDVAKARRLAHPAEPAPVVTDEAVEAAVDVAMDDGHNGLDCRPTRSVGETMRAALEAAAPLLGPRPLLDREAVLAAVAVATGHVPEMDQHEEGEWEAGCAACAGWGYPCEPLTRATDAVMKLARPMPTREQIEQAARNAMLARYPQSPRLATDVAAVAAPAVLALLNGAES